MCNYLCMIKELILFSTNKNLDYLYTVKKFANKNNFVLTVCTNFENLKKYIFMNRCIICNNNDEILIKNSLVFPKEVKINAFSIDDISRIGKFKEDDILPATCFFLQNNNFYTSDICGVLLKRLLISMYYGNIEKISNKYFISYCDLLGFNYKNCSTAMRKYANNYKSIIDLINTLFARFKNEQLLNYNF